MKISVNGNALVLTSDIKAEGIALIKKVNPNALTLKDKDGNDVFSVGYGANGGVNKNGVTFNGKTRDEDEFATLTLSVPADTKDAEKFVADTILPVWENLTKVGAQIVEATEAYTEQKAALLEVTDIA